MSQSPWLHEQSMPQQMAPSGLQTPTLHSPFLSLCTLKSADGQMKAQTRTNKKSNVTFKLKNLEMPAQREGYDVVAFIDV